MGRDLRQLLLYMVGYALILEVLLIAAIEFFPDFEEHLDTFAILASKVGLGGVMDGIVEGGVLGYVVGQQFFKGCNTLGTAAAVLFAVPAVAGEVHRGTLEVWLGRPYSRTRLLTERFVLGALAVVIPVFLTSATVPYLCGRIGEEVLLKPMMLCSLHQSAMLLAVYAVAFFLSTVGSNPTRIALVLLFLTTFEFAIYMIEHATQYSIYRMTDVEVFLRIADTGELPLGKMAALLAIAALGYLASLVAIRHRVP